MFPEHGAWWVVADLCEWQCDRTALAESLSRAEKERAMRFVNDALRARFEIGRGLMRRILGVQLGVSPERVELGESRFGRPFAVSAPGGFDFNVTHAGDRWAMVWGRGVRVGIDLESTGRVRDVLSLARRFFSRGELELLEGLADEGARDRAFVRLWTAKEAILKAVGCGISGGLASVEIAGEDSASDAAVDLVHSGVRWRLHRLDAPEGMALALAVEVPESGGAPPPRQVGMNPARSG